MMELRHPKLARSGLAVAAATAGMLYASVFSGAAVGTVVSHAPRQGLAPTGAAWRSSNWSGYAKTGKGFTSATGSWIVPTVKATPGNTFSSSWVGIDGFNNTHLIQTGTEQDWVNGHASYGAWWEILPANATFISMSVHPGDAMTASITKGTKWTITINDVTSGQSFTIHKSYNGPGSSAEWIEEAPFVNGSQARIANYGHTTFDPGTVNGADPNLTTSNRGVLIQSGAQVSTPSNPDSDTDGFNIAYGSAQPPPPGS